jgi:hypothetical protein
MRIVQTGFVEGAVGRLCRVTRKSQKERTFSDLRDLMATVSISNIHNTEQFVNISVID